ncbi:hypothetical protein ACSHWG_00845 [Leucobacter sp. Z1108]|uniref:phage terminase small subunit n=1 Tax=Leucobacter sp. Z1108 TaxID=3439066 RepID=UPI003F3245EB
MAGNGPPPKDARQRGRDTPVRELVKSDGRIGGFELPDDVLPQIVLNGLPQFDLDGVPVREEWHPQTIRWWNNWRESPQATRMVTGPDWDYLLDTALLHHQMWESGGKNSERAAEIRLRVAAFGATYADRLRIKWEIETPGDDFEVGNGHSNVSSMDDERRKRLAGGS